MRQILAVALLGSALFATAANADAIFADTTFATADYSQGFLYSAGPGNTATFSQCASCGNPGQGLQSQIVTSLDGGTIQTAAVFLGMIDTTFSYNPGSGAVTSIDASIDKDLSADLNNTYGNTFRFLLEQSGNFYQYGIPGPQLVVPATGGGTTGFNTLSHSGILATDFVLINTLTATLDTSSHPDFSGAAMLFGIGQYQSSSGLQGDDPVLNYAYDNFDVTVHAAAAGTPVPEPLTLSLFGAGLAGAAMLRRRGKRKA